MSCSHEQGFPFKYGTFKEKHNKKCPNNNEL